MPCSPFPSCGTRATAPGRSTPPLGSIGIPHTLAEIGVDDARVDRLAALATEDPNVASNPVPLDDAAHRTLLLASLEGRLP